VADIASKTTIGETMRELRVLLVILAFCGIVLCFIKTAQAIEDNKHCGWHYLNHYEIRDYKIAESVFLPNSTKLDYTFYTTREWKCL
jgi:hypothetical protein